MTQRYANFPGCSATTTGKAYTESFMYVAQKVGIELDTIDDWNCCGASAGHLQSKDLGDALPARSLAISEEQFGDEPVLALCAGCYVNLRRALVHARSSEERREQIQDIIGKPFEAKSEVVNGIEPFLEPEVQEQIKSQVIKPLNGLKVACYYGCALLRPRELAHFDDEENPQSMEEVLALSGAEPIDWYFKTECCGASHHISAPKASMQPLERIISNAAENGAEAIACACPLCMLNLDMREAEANKMRKAKGLPEVNIPVYYFTELLAASFGAPLSEVGLKRHFVPAVALIEEAQARIVEKKLTPEEEKAQRIAEAKAKAAARKAGASEEASAGAKASEATEAEASELGAAPAQTSSKEKEAGNE